MGEGFRPSRKLTNGLKPWKPAVLTAPRVGPPAFHSGVRYASPPSGTLRRGCFAKTHAERAFNWIALADYDIETARHLSSPLYFESGESVFDLLGRDRK